MFLHVLIQILFITLGFVGIILLLYWYSKQQGFLPNQMRVQNTSLHIDIESQQFLEPRKSLYVVRVGEKRFLLSSTEQQVSLISPLEPATQAEMEAIESSLQQSRTSQLGRPQFSNFKEQFIYSIKMLTQERFGGR